MTRASLTRSISIFLAFAMGASYYPKELAMTPFVFTTSMKADFVHLTYGLSRPTVTIFTSTPNKTRESEFTVRYCDEEKGAPFQFCGRLQLSSTTKQAVSDIWLPATAYDVTVFARHLIGFRRVEGKRFSLGTLNISLCDKQCYAPSLDNDIFEMDLDDFDPFFNGSALLTIKLPEYSEICPEYPSSPLKIAISYITAFGNRGHIVIQNARLKEFYLVTPMLRIDPPAVQVVGYIECPRGPRMYVFGKIVKALSDVNRKQRNEADAFLYSVFQTLVETPELQKMMDPVEYDLISVNLKEGSVKGLVNLTKVRVTGATKFMQMAMGHTVKVDREKIFISDIQTAEHVVIQANWELAHFNGTAEAKASTFRFSYTFEHDGARTMAKDFKLERASFKLTAVTGNFDAGQAANKTEWVHDNHIWTINECTLAVSDRVVETIGTALNEAAKYTDMLIYLQYYNDRKG